MVLWPRNPLVPPGNAVAVEIIPVSFIPANKLKAAAEGVFFLFFFFVA